MPKENPQALVDMVMALPGFARESGMHVVSVAPGRVELALVKRQDLLQFGGHFHGGVIAALADQAAGAAVSTILPEGKIGVTIEFKINFLSPADGDKLIARAEAMQGGGTIGVAKIEVISQNSGTERVCAFGTATMRSVDLPTRKS